MITWYTRDHMIRAPRLSEVQSGPGPGLFFRTQTWALALYVRSANVVALALDLRGPRPKGPGQGWSSPGPGPFIFSNYVFHKFARYSYFVHNISLEKEICN